MVQLAKDLIYFLREAVHGGLNLGGFAAFAHGLETVDFLLHSLLVLGAQLAAVFTQLLFDVIDEVVGAVEGFDLFLALFVILGELLGFLDALLDLIFGQIGGSGDGHVLGVSGAQVLGADGNNAVFVNGELNLDLRYAAGGGGDAGQLEAAQGLVVKGHRALALQHMDLNCGLAVCRGGEDLRFLGGDGGVAVNQAGEDVAFRLQTKGQRRDIQQQHVLDLAAQYACLDGGADGDALIGVDALEGFLAGDVFDSILHSRGTGGAAHQNDLVNLRYVEACILERDLHRANGAFHQVGGQLIELGAGQGDIQVLGAVGVSCDEGQVDVGRHHAGQVDLCFFSGFLEALIGHAVLLEVNAAVLAEDLGDIIDDTVVKVIAAQQGIAVGGQHFKDTVADLQDRDVKSAAAQVVDQDLVGVFLVKAIGQGSRSRLVDDAQHIQARDAARVLGGLALGIGEVGGHGDDRLGDGLAQVALGLLLHLLQDHGGNVLGRVVLAIDVDLEVGAHLALDGSNGAVGIRNGLALGDLANQTLAFLGEGDNGRRSARAFAVWDDDGFAAFHNGDAAVGGTKVDANNLAHDVPLSNPVYLII